MIESTRPAGRNVVNEYEYLVKGIAADFDVAASKRINRVQFRSSREEETKSAIEFARRDLHLDRQGNFGAEEASSLLVRVIVGLTSERTRERGL